ncbi:MAG: hypothetical protein K8F91_02470 [Candidatus Obscuribacterales bacterium]|nr:hypothetical protein [Candidatus Obscuribacterales bacterium]
MTEANIIEIPNQKGNPVAKLTLPEEWERGAKPPRPGYLWISKFFVSPRDERVGIGLRAPAKKTYHYLTAQENPFLSLLRRPGHELTEEEFLSVHLLLEQVGWPGRFKKDWAKTVSYDQGTVLRVQGLWTQESVYSQGMIFDTTNDSGNYVQEAWFVAPPELFEDYVEEAEAIFESVMFETATEPVREAQEIGTR